MPWEEPVHQTLHQKVWYSQVYSEGRNKPDNNLKLLRFY